MATITYRLKPKVSVDLLNQAWYNYTKEQAHDLTFKVSEHPEGNYGETDLEKFCCHRLETLKNFLTNPKTKCFTEIYPMDELNEAIASRQTRSPKRGGCIHCLIERLKTSDFKFAEAA